MSNERGDQMPKLTKCWHTRVLGHTLHTEQEIRIIDGRFVNGFANVTHCSCGHFVSDIDL